MRRISDGFGKLENLHYQGDALRFLSNFLAIKREFYVNSTLVK